MKIEYMPDCSLDEIYQPVEIRVAFLSENDRQCHCFVKCKDFLSDILVHTFQDAPHVSVYKFNYDKREDEPLCLHTTRLLVEIPEDVDDSTIPRAVSLLNRLEQEMNVSLTTAKEVYGWKNRVFLFESDDVWQSSPTMISTYVSLIRFCAGNFDPNEGTIEEALRKGVEVQWREGEDDRETNLNNTDVRYIKEAIPVLMKLLTKDRISMAFDSFDYTDYDMRDVIHENCGLLSYANGVTPWQRSQ